MRISTLALCGVLTWGQLSACAAEPPANVSIGQANVTPRNLNDFYELRRKKAPAEIAAIQAEASARARKEAGVSSEGVVPSCVLPTWFLFENPAFTLLRTSASETEWLAHTTEIAAAIEKRNDTFARLKVGEDIDPAYSATVGAFRRAMAANTERARVYAMRAGEDQFHRSNSVIVQNGLIWAKNLRAESRGYLMEENVAQVCQSDRSNTEWLRKDLAAYGWPRISSYGAAMDADAWLIIQHSDHDAAFQTEVLKTLEPLLKTKDTSHQNYAFLYDRVAIATKKRQRYGTQGRCTGPGKWEPYPVEDESRLDALRAEIGLEPEAEYSKRFTFCTAELAAAMASVK
ncbi:DUF6624 domain-containing protein [Asticcacaulis sp.]|uniref:DUF6624 domain-containing protein n=1 Tax=Asticcacaulis sp. TaxID=1872648 RepID=UPI002625A332|nr:DUF6624 domain-containing protein [Asticcacaulis sp.]